MGDLTKVSGGVASQGIDVGNMIEDSWGPIFQGAIRVDGPFHGVTAGNIVEDIGGTNS